MKLPINDVIVYLVYIVPFRNAFASLAKRPSDTASFNATDTSLMTCFLSFLGALLS
jgi:hypothetical protein